MRYFYEKVVKWCTYINGSKDVGLGDLLWDTLGLGLDFYGMKGDYEDFKKVLDTPGVKGKDLYQPFRERQQEIQDSRQNALTDMENNLNSRRQAELDAENLRHENKMDDIRNTIDRLENGEIAPPAGVDRDTYLRELNRSLGAETTINADNLSNIRDAYRKEMQDNINQILDTYSQKERKLVQETVRDLIQDHGYDVKGEIDNLQDFLSTNGFYHTGGEGAGEISAVEEGMAALETDTFWDGLDNLTNEELEHLAEGLRQFLEGREK